MRPIHEFAKMIRVTPQTLRNWDKKEILIPHCKSSNGYRYYTETHRQFLGSSGKKEKMVIGYCRVSSNKQKDDLERQVENVSMYMIAKGYSFEVITDIGSGINVTVCSCRLQGKRANKAKRMMKELLADDSGEES